MIKIKSINFNDHNFFKQLEIDFTKENKEIAKNIFIIGENGIGKTKLIEEIKHIYNKNQKLILKEYFDFCIKSYQKTKKTYLKELKINSKDKKTTIKLIFNFKKSDFSLIYILYKRYYEFIEINDKQKNNLSWINMISWKDITNFYNNFDNFKKNILEYIELNKKSNMELKKEDWYKIIKNDNIEIEINECKKEIVFNKGCSFNNFSDGQKLETILYLSILQNSLFWDFKNKNANKVKKIFKEKIIEEKINILENEANYLTFMMVDEIEILQHPGSIENIVKKIKSIYYSQLFWVTHSPFVLKSFNMENDIIINLNDKDNKNINVKNYDSISDIVEKSIKINNENILNESLLWTEGRTDKEIINHFKKGKLYKFKVVSNNNLENFVPKEKKEYFKGINKIINGANGVIYNFFQWLSNNKDSIYTPKHLYLLDGDEIGIKKYKKAEKIVKNLLDSKIENIKFNMDNGEKTLFDFIKVTKTIEGKEFISYLLILKNKKEIEDLLNNCLKEKIKRKKSNVKNFLKELNNEEKNKEMEKFLKEINDLIK